eukprot:2980533-Prymnesium_polylepis.1
MQQRVPEALRRAGKVLSLLRGVGEARFPPPMRPVGHVGLQKRKEGVLSRKVHAAPAVGAQE